MTTSTRAPTVQTTLKFLLIKILNTLKTEIDNDKGRDREWQIIILATSTAREHRNRIQKNIFSPQKSFRIADYLCWKQSSLFSIVLFALFIQQRTFSASPISAAFQVNCTNHLAHTKPFCQTTVEEGNKLQNLSSKCLRKVSLNW